MSITATKTISRPTEMKTPKRAHFQRKLYKTVLSSWAWTYSYVHVYSRFT